MPTAITKPLKVLIFVAPPLIADRTSGLKESWRGILTTFSPVAPAKATAAKTTKTTVPETILKKRKAVEKNQADRARAALENRKVRLFSHSKGWRKTGEKTRPK